jgi:hypothetical protein
MNIIEPVHPEYTSIERHIRHAHIERVPVIAHAIAGFIVDCWNAIQAPPAPAAILIDRRRESRGSAARIVGRPGVTH